MVFQGEMEHQDQLNPMENMVPRGKKDSLDLQVEGPPTSGGGRVLTLE